MTDVKLCIDYISTEDINCFNCYYLDSKNEEVALFHKVIIEGVSLRETSLNELKKVAYAIKDAAINNSLNIVGKISFYVTDRNMFSFSDIFPNIKKSRIAKFNKRDLEESFPEYEKKNIYIETQHEDGSLGTVIFTTFCPLEILEKLEYVAKELKLTIASVSSSGYLLTHRYEETLKKQYPNTCIVAVEEDYTLINLYINGVMVDTLLVEHGHAKLDDESTKEVCLKQIKSRVMAIVSKHEFGLEKYPVNDVIVTSSDENAKETVADYLKESTKFEVGCTYIKTSGISKIPPKYIFKKFHRSLFSRGYTLIEVVVSVAIFAIISTVAFASIANMVSIPRRNERNMAINNIISDISEVYRNNKDTFVATYYQVNGLEATDTTITAFTYDADYSLVTSNATYTLSFTHNDEDIEIVSFVDTSGTNYIERVLIRG